MQINEVAKPKRAGIVPYYVDNGVLKMLFMVPSDPEFGGPLPQIAKGEIDPGETAQQAAVREGSEELGLRRENIARLVPIKTVAIVGLNASYSMTIFAAQISDPAAFSTPHYETKSTHWMTLEQFLSQGRKNQQSLIRAVSKTVSLTA